MSRCDGGLLRTRATDGGGYRPRRRPGPSADTAAANTSARCASAGGWRLAQLVAARRLAPLIGGDLDRQGGQEHSEMSSADRSCGPTARMTACSGAGQAVSSRSLPSRWRQHAWSSGAAARRYPASLQPCATSASIAPGGLGSSPAQGGDLALSCSRQLDVDGSVRVEGRSSAKLARSSRRSRPAARSPTPAATSSPARTPRSRRTRRTSARRCRSSRWRRISSRTLLVAANDIMPTRRGLEPATVRSAPASIQARTVGADTPSISAAPPTLAPRSLSATC